MTDTPTGGAAPGRPTDGAISPVERHPASLGELEDLAHRFTRAADQGVDQKAVTDRHITLTGGQFSHATMAGARLRRCELARIGGVTSFRGATVAGQDLVALSYTLANALGIGIEEDDRC